MFAALSRFSRRDLALILVLLVFVVTTLAFTFLVLPKIKSYLAVTRTESTLSMIVDNGDLLDNQLKNLSGEIELLQRRLHGDMASLPVKEIEAHVVGKLQQISWQNDIQLVGIEPSSGATIETFHEILFRVTLAGDYMNMYDWLREVGADLGFVLVKQYEMQPLDRQAQNPRLSVELTMATYRAMNR
jgi:Tfp pilus assembly protein PilO